MKVSLKIYANIIFPHIALPSLSHDENSKFWLKSGFAVKLAQAFLLFSNPEAGRHKNVWPTVHVPQKQLAQNWMTTKVFDF